MQVLPCKCLVVHIIFLTLMKNVRMSWVYIDAEAISRCFYLIPLLPIQVIISIKRSKIKKKNLKGIWFSKLTQINVSMKGFYVD